MPDDTGLILALGLGNTLLSDEQIGVRIAETVARDSRATTLGVRALDGGTMGLSLLVEMEDAGALIVADAAELGAAPGAVTTFEGAQMDRFLRTRGRTPHDIGLDDMLDGLRLRGAMPANRALVAVQPAHLGVGETMTPAVAEALPRAVEEVFALAGRWRTRTPTA